VIFYEGRPSQMLVERTDSIGRELGDVVKDFDAWSAKELPGINSALAKKKLEPVKLMTREDWDKSNAAEAGGGTATALTEREMDRFERD
jgi:hypothetical protein